MKMILAIIHQEDEMDTVGELNRNNFFVTKLSTTGGFLREKSTTILVGTEDKNTDKVISIIKGKAKTRKTVEYSMPFMGTGEVYPVTGSLVPIQVESGGCTIFVLPVERMEKA